MCVGREMMNIRIRAGVALAVLLLVAASAAAAQDQGGFANTTNVGDITIPAPRTCYVGQGAQAVGDIVIGCNGGDPPGITQLFLVIPSEAGPLGSRPGNLNMS